MAITKTSLEVEKRDQTGKGHNRRLRASGLVPANVYGMDVAPYAVSVDPRKIEVLLRTESGRNSIVTLSMEGGKSSRDVMCREIQREPITDQIWHVDFLRVDPDKRMEVQIPLNIVGEAHGVKIEGGVLDFIHREVLVSCLPATIPGHIDCDVSELHIGQHLSVKDLKIPAGVEVLDDAENVLLSVAAPAAEEEAEEAAEGDEAAAAEPTDTDGEKSE